MSLQVCLLKTGEVIVGDVREVIDKEQNVFMGYRVSDPFVIELTNVKTVSVIDDVVEPNDHTSTKVVFKQWAPLAERMEFDFTKDFVEVIYPPCRDILNSYVAIIADYKKRLTVRATIVPEETVISGTGVPVSELTDPSIEESSSQPFEIEENN